MPEDRTRGAGPLRPIELASASVLSSMAAVLTVAGFFLPHVGVVAIFAVVPFGVLAHHYRLRALVVATVAAAVLSFLVAGTGTLTNVVPCAAVGGLVGVAKYRGWGFGAVLTGMALVGPVLGAVSVGLLWIFSSLRKLTIDQIKNTWKGIRKVAWSIPLLRSPAGRIDDFVNTATKHWEITVAVVVVASCLWIAVVGWVFVGAVLERLKSIRGQDRLDLDLNVTSGLPAGEPAPVPVSLRDVGYRYPETKAEALTSVTLEVESDEMVAVVGDNGSGKSTLARLLAGRPPTSGVIERPGPAGLGRPEGTAMIFQNPDTQVLGVRVADDVVWGLHDASLVDVDGLLDTVGLTGMADRETSGLSGGELQRLAVAAALARRPRLLISDESTAMVDQVGRDNLITLLRRLPKERGVTVVHVTHRPEEAAAADSRIHLARGRLVSGEPAADAAVTVEQRGIPTGRPVPPLAITPQLPARLETRGLSHTYSIGTPWAKEALVGGIDLVVEPGEGVLVVGGNGSGKSTLAWILAGLLRPTYGEAFLGGIPVRDQIGRVGLAFQHARLQMLRDVVEADLRNAGAPDHRAVVAALAAVGLDPTEIAERRVDELSGGQQRRVALAGLLARRSSVMVLDEPLAGLDRSSRESLLDLLSRLRRSGFTVVVISHDLTGMEAVCDRAVVLEQGRLVSDGSMGGTAP